MFFHNPKYIFSIVLHDLSFDRMTNQRDTGLLFYDKNDIAVGFLKIHIKALYLTWIWDLRYFVLFERFVYVSW
jgi:hypothetical protein